MSIKLKEGDLEFDFRQAIRAEKFDDHTQKISHCMKGVDFMVEWPDSLWLIEVKDPDSTQIPQQYRDTQKKQFMKKLESQSLFSKELGPKIKDTFLFLYLKNELPAKPLKYFVLLAFGELDPELLPSLTDTLQRKSCLLGPDNSAWQNHYVEDAVIFTQQTWNKKLTQCPVVRT